MHEVNQDSLSDPSSATVSRGVLDKAQSLLAVASSSCKAGAELQLTSPVLSTSKMLSFTEGAIMSLQAIYICCYTNLAFYSNSFSLKEILKSRWFPKL